MMGLSCGFRCFGDPDSRALKKGNRTQNEGEAPIRVVSEAKNSGRSTIEMSSMPSRSYVPAQLQETEIRETEDNQFSSLPEEPKAQTTIKPPPTESSTVGAIGRSTSEPTVLPSQTTSNTVWAKEQTITEQEAELLRECLDRKKGYMPPTKWSEGNGIRAAELFGLPTIQAKPGLQVREMTEEEAEMKRRTDDDNSRKSVATSYVPMIPSYSGPGTYGYGGSSPHTSTPSYGRRASYSPMRASNLGSNDFSGMFGGGGGVSRQYGSTPYYGRRATYNPAGAYNFG